MKDQDLFVRVTGVCDPAFPQNIHGRFTPHNHNHGRKMWKRYYPRGPDCFLYYWDNRNGDYYCGWWFGREVGGYEVFKLQIMEGKEFGSLSRNHVGIASVMLGQYDLRRNYVGITSELRRNYVGITSVGLFGLNLDMFG